MRRTRPRLRAAALTPTVLAALPATASAHGIQGRADLPVPLIAFYWASAVVLIVSFAALALAWRTPRLARTAPEAVRNERPTTIAGWIPGAIGTLGLALVIATAMFGSTELNANPAPIIVFVPWWILIAIIGGTIGDVWRAIHPAAFLARIAGFEEHRRDSPWPAVLGIWLATIALAAFIWLELVYPTAANVRLLGTLVLAWLLATLIGMQRYGVRTWLDHAEPFAVYTRLLSRMAIRADGAWRAPLTSLTTLRPRPGTVALMGLLIGSVSYDGLSRTLWWKQRVGTASVRLVERGIDAQTAQLIFGSFGLATMVTFAIVTFVGAAQLARIAGRLPRRTEWGTTAQAFAPSLVPIALAYVVAHYCSYVWFQSQRLIALASDPFGRGVDWLGTAEQTIDYTTLSNEAIWAIQVGSIVIGHVLGLMLAHDRALQIARSAPAARALRSQWPMLALMVLYTVGGLYFLSEGLNA